MNHECNEEALQQELEQLKEKWAKEAWTTYRLTAELALATEGSLSLEELLQHCSSIGTERVMIELDPDKSFIQALGELLKN